MASTRRYIMATGSYTSCSPPRHPLAARNATRAPGLSISTNISFTHPYGFFARNNSGKFSNLAYLSSNSCSLLSLGFLGFLGRVGLTGLSGSDPSDGEAVVVKVLKNARKRPCRRFYGAVTVQVYLTLADKGQLLTGCERNCKRDLEIVCAGGRWPCT